MRTIDNLPACVKQEIRNKVETELERYRMWKFFTFQEREASLTAAWSDTLKGFTGTISDQTGNIAVYNTDEPGYRQRFCERIEQAVNRLPRRERQIISDRYMQSEPIFDYVVFNQLLDPPLSEVTYYKIKNRAMAILAMALSIQINGLQDVF
ncbi:hypothetical protein BSK54_10365 [Paenibacillus odorifer]|uniref:ArpU family phage packaging/lysis transcriptional regulator n=1 Tax=Paenibacillus odorifer TaxID=189426 RepID=UPI00096EED90|nr:ArpU family phage packaging/lysis transcriptional regulator [Paenibacillus odorifer]OME02653.1 hypothetical protein BSK54_10365 [Paenibacillus odorifer]